MPRIIVRLLCPLALALPLAACFSYAERPSPSSPVVVTPPPSQPPQSSTTVVTPPAQ